MLHIIFFILKCIGWLLLVILGLVLFLLCIVLFVPFRYQVAGECRGKIETLRGNIRFSWLLHLLDGTVTYQNREANWNIRIAWKRIRSDQEESPAAKVTATPETEKDVGETVRAAVSVGESITAAEKINLEPEEAGEKSSVPKEPESKVHAQKKPESKVHSQNNLESKVQPQKKKKNAVKKTKTRKSKIADTASKMKKGSQISRIFEKIKYTFEKICGTISSLREKKDKIMEFLTDKVHQSAFRAALKEVKKLLFRLRPKRAEGRVHYGFEDPSLTGYVLAAVSMVYPLIGEQAEIQPDFENKVLEGEVNITGKIRTIYGVMMGWNLIWNKNVRTTFKHIRTIKDRIV